MVSVDRLLDDHEVVVRADVEACDRELAAVAARLEAARRELEHVQIAKGMLRKLLYDAEPVAPAVPGEVVEPAVGIVPDWRADLGAGVLPGGYRMLYQVLAQAGDGMKCKELSVALGFGTEHAKVEGVRAKLKRLLERGWVRRDAGGVFTAAV